MHEQTPPPPAAQAAAPSVEPETHHTRRGPHELDDLNHFETVPPAVCPKCNARVRSQFMPSQIAHDIEKCEAKPVVTTTQP